MAGVRDPRVSSQTTAVAGDRGNPSRDFRTSRGARAGQSLDMGASAAPGPASLPPSQLINKVRKRNTVNIGFRNHPPSEGSRFLNPARPLKQGSGYSNQVDAKSRVWL